MTRLVSAARRAAPAAIDLRRAIHRHPERGFAEFATTGRIAAALEAEGIAARVREDGTGLVADVGPDAPRVAWRADLDALPIHEMTNLAFRSNVDGWMHACGHDAHSAIATAIATVLHEQGDVSVRFIFQPAEESFPGGARQLTLEGAIDGISAIAAFHVDPSLEVGKIGLRIGAITSSSDRFQITVEGPGGHTARPHETVDTLYAAGRILTDLPMMVHRSLDSRIPISLVFGQLRGGEADNVIPTRVTMAGTVRMLDDTARDHVPMLIDRLAQEIAQPTGAKVSTTFETGIPPVINDPRVIAAAHLAVVETLGSDAVAEAQPSMGAEDFADYLETIPGALLRLGVRTPGKAELALHSAVFDIDEGAIAHGIAAGAATLYELSRRV